MKIEKQYKDIEENLRKWFKQKWVNIGKKKKGGGHPPCGTSGKKRGYAKCVPASKAASMTKKQKASATRRKRAAQNKAGRGGKQSAGQGKAPIRVSTKPQKRGKKSENLMNVSKNKLKEMIRREYNNIVAEYNNMMTEAQFEMFAEKQDACYHKVKARYDVWPSAYASGALVKCRKVGAANWGNKSKKESYNSYDIWNENTGKGMTIEFYKTEINEADYQGRSVKLNKPMQGDSKKFKVYVNSGKKNKDGTIKVKKVEFGAKGMKIKKSNPERRRSFRARHNCDNPGPKTKARYWSCRKW